METHILSARMYVLKYISWFGNYSLFNLLDPFASVSDKEKRMHSNSSSIWSRQIFEKCMILNWNKRYIHIMIFLQNKVMNINVSLWNFKFFIKIGKGLYISDYKQNIFWHISDSWGIGKGFSETCYCWLYWQLSGENYFFFSWEWFSSILFINSLINILSL